MKKNILYFYATMVILLSACSKTTVCYTNEISNVRHPQILYWFWDDSTLENKHYLKDIDKMAKQSPFDLVMLTSRFTDSTGFWNTERLKPHLAEAVRYAHEKKIKIALQLWPMNRSRELFIRDFPINKEEAESLIAENECELDSKGHADVVNAPTIARFTNIFDVGLTKVWLFKKTSGGYYDPATLKEADNKWLTVAVRSDFSVEVAIDAPLEYAGYTAYVITEHYYNYFDVCSEMHRNIFKTMLDAYSDIPFDGTALDENGNMGIRRPATPTMTERTWCDKFAEYYQNTYHADPVRLLFDMRYAPDNHPEIRIKSINTYFEARTQGPIGVENFFYQYSKNLFGKDCFIGCHSTFHNALTGDDVWSTGLDWWDLPREYGQTDEGFPMHDRMGVGISGSEPVMYNMFYNRSKESMFREALDKAAFGVREHYHAWNDHQGWGKDIGDDDFLEDVRPVEQRIRLLNHFDPAPPQLPVLFIYNFPYLFNWYPDETQQNSMGIRQTDMQNIPSSLWQAGYPCAAVPSTWIEKGLITVREDGKIQIKDRIFEAAVFLYPQYAKTSSFEFMKRLLHAKGKLLFKGEASYDFDGNDCRALFAELSKQATPFDVNAIERLGISGNPVKNGVFLQDGSVVMSDYNSVKEKKNTAFSVKIGEDEYSGSYEGVFALKIDKNGAIEKLACGNFSSLQKNGKAIIELKKPADILIEKKKGKKIITLKGKDNEIIIKK